MNYISIEEVIASAKIRLRLTDTNNADMALEHYILSGARSISSLDSFIIKQKSIDLNDGIANLPKDFFTLIAARLQDPIATADDTSLSIGDCSRAIYVNSNYLYSNGCDCSDDDLTPFADTFQIVGNQIHFNSYVNATSILLTYQARNVDDNGLPLIPEDHARALTAYASYQYALSYRVTGLDPSGYMPDQIEMYRQEWMAQKAYCRGLAVKKDARHRKAELMATMNALLTGKNPYLK